MKAVLGKISLKCRRRKRNLPPRGTFEVGEAGRFCLVGEKQPEKKEYAKPTLEQREKLVEVTEGNEVIVTVT